MSYLLATDITDRVVKDHVDTTYLDQADQALEDLAEAQGIRDTSCVTFDAGDISGTVLVKGANQTGATLILDGFTAATGKITAGTKIRIAGQSRTYTIETEAAISGSQTTLTIYPALEYSPVDNAPVTFQKLHKTVKRWMIAVVGKAICFDLAFTNNNEQNPDYDKYFLKFQEYKKITADLENIITAEMISNVVNEKADRVSMFGSTVRA